MRQLFFTVFAIFWTLLAYAQTVDSIDNIILKIPVSWQINKQASFTELKYFDSNKRGFCMLAVYNAVAAPGDKKAAFQTEWRELIEKNFSVSTTAGPVTLKTKSGNSFQRSGSDATDKGGNQYYVQLNVYDCGPTVQSIMAISNSRKQLELYDSLWQSLIVGIKKQKINPGTTTNTPSATTSAKLPPANVIFTARWGKSEAPIGAYSNDGLVNLAFSGYKRCEYNFKPDGTYTFQGENWGGQVNSQKFRLKNDKEYGLIDEVGTFKVSGNQLVITPSKNVYRVVTKDGKVQRTESLGLQKRTYTWQTYYAIGMEETRLVLTASKPNTIDGDFSTYEPAVSFPDSYCYVLGKKMFFTFQPLVQ
ncbi:MAG: hypothetical protein WCF67_10655 [Chitinophagaceae bacterium]